MYLKKLYLKKSPRAPGPPRTPRPSAGTAKNSRSFRTKALEFATSYKHEHSAGKGVGSALLYAAPCRLYVSRLYRNELALSFGGNSLLLLQAASGADAQDWVVAIAACLFFSSAAFEAVLAECRRFFDAAHKTIDGRLSPVEALDLVRAMGREVSYSQVVAAAKTVAPDSGWFGIREFTYLVRTVCADSDPRSELLRAFRLLDTSTSDVASEPHSHELHNAAAAHPSSETGCLSVADLTSTMRAAGVPDEHVLMVIRAAGADLGDEMIPYTRLADALYPAAATAAKRRRDRSDGSDKELQLEMHAREMWENQRNEIMRAVSAGMPNEQALAAMRGPERSRSAKASRPRSKTEVLAPSASVPALGVRGVSSRDMQQLTPRSKEIVRSMTAGDVHMPATPRTIADRVLRARRATEVSKTKAASEVGRRLSAGSPSARSPEPAS